MNTPEPNVLKVFKPTAVLPYANQETDRSRLDYWQTLSLDGLNTDSTHQAVVEGQYLGTYVFITFESKEEKEAWMVSHPVLYPEKVAL